MQKNIITKSKLFLALLISFTATCVKAHSQDTALVEHNANTEQLTALLSTMNNEEQAEFTNLLSEVKNVADKNKKVSVRAKVRNLQTLIKKISISRLSGVALRLVFAYICWDIIQPMLKDRGSETRFKETSSELPKAIAGVLVIDGIKDFFKEIREISEECFSIIYVSLFPTYETAE